MNYVISTLKKVVLCNMWYGQTGMSVQFGRDVVNELYHK
jgi:hypothetical protein